MFGSGESYCVLPSHLTQVRGLKDVLNCHLLATLKSHLTQVRGLKDNLHHVPDSWLRIAPHAGARIESLAAMPYSVWLLSHLTQVRGLKDVKPAKLRNSKGIAPHAGARIERPHKYLYRIVIAYRTSRRCAD